MSNYRALLSVSVEHGYYANGICSCLDFQPTAKTRRLFDNAGLLLKKTTDGIQLICDESRLEALALCAQDPREPLCFDFKVYSTDPHFRSYTEPFADIADQILYLDNRDTSTGDDRIRLSASAHVSGSDFVDADAEKLGDLLSRQDRLLPPLFVLRIYAETGAVSHIRKWLEPGLTSYSIVFKPRRTLWQYYLFGRMARRSLVVSDPDKRVEFDALGEASLPDRRVAFVFRSQQSIPLNEHYDCRFQLREQGPGGDNVLINRLPVASIARIGKETVAEQSMVVSEIYVNC